MTTRTFAVRYGRWSRPLLSLVGFGPRRATVQLSDTELLVHMGWGFHAVIPRRAILNVRQRGPVWYALGVHRPFRGRWIVNGSPHGMIALDLMPPVPARTLGIPITLKELDISLVEPEAFIAALGGSPHAE